MKALIVAAVAGCAVADQISYTSCEETQGKKLHSLHKHEVKCPTGSGLRGWQMVKDTCGNDKYRFWLRCSDSNTVGSATTYSTGCHGADDKTLDHLDDFEPTCITRGKVMQYWDMLGSSDDSCGNSNREIKYGCSSISESNYETTSESFLTDCYSAHDEKLQHLRSFNVDCGSYAYLTYYKMLSGGSDACGSSKRQIQFKCRTKSLGTTMKDTDEIRAENPCSAGDSPNACATHRYYIKSKDTGRYLVAGEVNEAPVWLPSPTDDGCSDWYLSNLGDQAWPGAYEEEFLMYTSCDGVYKQLAILDTRVVIEDMIASGGYKSPQLKSSKDYEFTIHETYLIAGSVTPLGQTGYEYYLTTSGNEGTVATRWGYGNKNEKFAIIRKD